jgi:glycosyltransferase involved in cell wall biosynthesis
MIIYAHTLFKNSEKWLWFSVTSVINHVDKVLLWDTGSTDNSWQIAKLLKDKYGDKIDLKQYGEVTTETFYKARQEMLDATDADWFILVDDDEIWWEESISNLKLKINNSKDTEAFVVPTINLVGDIFHKQADSAGRYKFGDKVGHFNLRAVKRNIEGLHSVGSHGVWGWADKDGKQIQVRNTFKIINAPYLHTTFLPRSKDLQNINNVPKRLKKIKYEIGNRLPLDYYFPESFFKERPEFIESPWKNMTFFYRLRAMLETPFKKIKRRFKNEKVGY